jgi:3-ketosteroid 9alpha-monooxygenase subunit B
MHLDDTKAPLTPPQPAPAELVVRWSGRVYRVAYRPGTTLLETMRWAHLPAASVCEQGVCGSCIVRLRQGKVELRENHVLTDADVADGYTLACQGVPASEVCEIEIE